MQFRPLDKIKTISWSSKRGGNHFVHITVESRDLPPPKLLMVLCFMFESSRETPACPAAPEVCTKCPTGAPHQAQGTSAQSHLVFPPLFSMTTPMLRKAPLSERQRNENKFPFFSPLCLSVSLFISKQSFRLHILLEISETGLKLSGEFSALHLSNLMRVMKHSLTVMWK